MLRIERSTFSNAILEEASEGLDYKFQNVVCIYLNNEFLTSHYDSDKEKLVKTLKHLLVKFFKKLYKYNL